MNDLLTRLRNLIRRSDEEVSISRAALAKYFACVDEWNTHYFDDEWCESPRGQSCADFIDWFNEVHQ